jgi:hypothetical protein
MSCYGLCFPCKRISQMLGELYLSTRIEASRLYQASSIRTLVCSTKLSQRSQSSKQYSFRLSSFIILTPYSLAFAPGIFNPAVSPDLSPLGTKRTLTHHPKQLVEATSRELDVPRSRMCVISLSRDHPRELAEYGGLRVIM